MFKVKVLKNVLIVTDWVCQLVWVGDDGMAGGGEGLGRANTVGTFNSTLTSQYTPLPSSTLTRSQQAKSPLAEQGKEILRDNVPWYCCEASNNERTRKTVKKIE